MATYVGWLKEAEKVYPDRTDLTKRVRRLYYSVGTAAGPGRVNPGVAGPGFDRLIDDSVETAALTSAPLTLETLNGLFETDAIVTPSGERIDPTHIFAMLDLSLSGPTTTGSAMQNIGGAPLAGIFTWTGDLASWFVEWAGQKERKLAEAAVADSTAVDESVAIPTDLGLLLSLVDSKVGRDDLLSDMDAQVMAADDVQRTPGLLGGTASLSRPLSEILDEYYGGTAVLAKEAERFPRFVRSAQPPIPHSVPDPAKPLEVALDSTAEQAIFDALFATAEQLIQGGAINRAGTPTALTNSPEVLRHIAQRFVTFLQVGLTSGSAPWP